MKILIAALITFALACVCIKRGFIKSNLMFHKSRFVVKIYMFFVCCVCTFVFSQLYYLFVDISANYYYNKEFVLDSPSKCIIHWNINTMSDEIKHIYYEADFDKNEITMKEENEEYEFFYRGIVEKKYNAEIKEIIENVVNDEKNMVEITIDEKMEYYKNEKRYSFYFIETYDGKKYYIRDINQMKKLDELLSNYKNKIY